MDNVNKIHIGDNSVNKLLFASPTTGKHGDALWSYYKYANDAGGYYVHGLWLAPCSTYMYWWPWDLGVPSGALKDVNNGAHYWGYVQDGYNKNITKGMNTNFPSNGWPDGSWRIAVAFFSNTEQAIDLGDNPVTITFLDDRFDNCTFTASSESEYTVSSDKRTITINKVGNNHIACYIEPPAAQKTLEGIRKLLTNVYANVHGLTIHTAEVDKPVDPSTVRCWTVYHGNDVLYHENKTKENAWEAYNLITTETIGKEGKLIAKSFVGLDGTKKLPTLDVYKDSDFYSKAADGKVTFQRFNGILNNKEVAAKVKEWFATHTISQTFINSSNRTKGLFYASDIDGTVTLNIDEANISGVAEFADSNIEKVIINTGTVTSLHELFYRAGNLREVEFENAARSQDLSGAFEFCGNILKLPKINWSDGNRSFNSTDASGNITTIEFNVPCSNAGFAFEYCYRLPELPQYGATRDAKTNVLTFTDYAPQVFNQCKALTKIGPILDFRYVKPSSAYLIFGGCTALTDLRLKNLNHGSWRFDEKAINGVVQGNLSALDADSINYLIDNLSDLTITSSDDEHAISEVRTAELHYPYGWEYPIDFTKDLTKGQSGDSATATKITLTTLINKTATSSNFYTTTKSVEELKIKVEGITENIVVGIGSGTYATIATKITQNGTYTLNNLTPVWAIKLYSLVADSGTVVTPVTITVLSKDIITDAQVTAAKAKGWTLFMGDIEKTVGN